VWLLGPRCVQLYTDYDIWHATVKYHLSRSRTGTFCTQAVFTVRKQECHFLHARGYASAGTSYGYVSVCLSVTSRCSIELAEPVELVFGTGAFFHLSCTALKGNSGISRCFPQKLCSKFRTSKLLLRHINRRTCC